MISRLPARRPELCRGRSYFGKVSEEIFTLRAAPSSKTGAAIPVDRDVKGGAYVGAAQTTAGCWHRSATGRRGIRTDVLLPTRGVGYRSLTQTHPSPEFPGRFSCECRW